MSKLTRELRAENGMLRARLVGIAEIIEAVDDRAMAADGPVTPTRNEITADELIRIYRIAKGRSRRRGEGGNQT